MDIGFTEEQQLLRDTARKFLDCEGPTNFVRQMMATEAAGWWEGGGMTCCGGEVRGGFTVSGTKLFVPDAHLGDVVVVAARSRDGSTMEDGISLFLVPKGTAGVAVRLLPSVDETRKVCEVRFDNVVLPATALLGELHEGWPAVAGVIDRAAVALSAEICGAAQRVLDMTVEYAKLRTAFGKPIGSYQGVKHKCADMLIEIENAKSLTYYAAWAVDKAEPDASLAVSK